MPGPITSHLSDAPNDIIQLGAVPISSSSDIIKHLNLSEISSKNDPYQTRKKLLKNLSMNKKKRSMKQCQIVSQK